MVFEIKMFQSEQPNQQKQRYGDTPVMRLACATRPPAVTGRCFGRYGAYARPRMHHLLLVIFVLLAFTANAQQVETSPGMTKDRLHDLILEVGSDVLISGNMVQFTYDGAILLCISDSAADRMRIISPIIELSEIESEQLLMALAANFHTVLDARYAISDGVMYAAYIHPLRPLSDEEVYSAIRQVARARNTFGDEYTSGELFFGGGTAP